MVNLPSLGLAICVLSAIPCSLFGGSPAVIAIGSDNSTPKQPQAVIDSRGKAHVVFGDGEAVFYCQSADGGKTFSKPNQAFSVANMSLGMRRGPRVAIANDNIVVTAIGGPIGKGRDGDLQAWNSPDGGKSWSGPVRVNDEANSAREGLHAMCSGEDGSIWCVWLDLRSSRTEVYASKSIDAGLTWLPNKLIYRSPEKNVCECCHPSIAIQGETVMVMFRNSLDGNRDMYLSRSINGGESFEPAVKLGQGEWKLNACPMDGGMLAIQSQAQPVTVWNRKGTVYLTNADTAQEEKLGIGGQPWIAATQLGFAVAWTSPSEKKLYVKLPNSKELVQRDTAAIDPIVVSNASASERVMVLWETKIDGRNAVVSESF